MTEDTAATVETTEITIQGLTFEVPAPYSEGHVLTAGEASALNQTLAENLRNNFAVNIKKAIAKYREVNKIADEVEIAADKLDKDELDAELAKYATEYKFGVRKSGGTRTPKDPVEAEAQKIALIRIKAALAKKNIDVKSIDKERMAKLVADALEKYPDIRESAARRVAEMNDLTSAILDI